MTHSDDDLKTRFEELRRHEEATAPNYHALLRRPTTAAEADRAGTRRRKRAALAFALVASVAMILWWGSRPVAPEKSFDPAFAGPLDPGKWSMPTDVLLDLSTLPGDDLWSGFPEIGGSEIGRPEHGAPVIGRPPVESSEGAKNESHSRRIPV
jgi:hypothetical protein